MRAARQYNFLHLTLRFWLAGPLPPSCDAFCCPELRYKFRLSGLYGYRRLWLVPMAGPRATLGVGQGCRNSWSR